MHKSPTFGPISQKGGVLFSIPSKTDISIELLIYRPGCASPFIRAPLEKTCDIWQVFVPDLTIPYEYSYIVDGHEIIDPYSKELSQTSKWKDRRVSMRSASYSNPFDWQGVVKPNLPLNELIIYEMHVRGFTKDPSSQVTAPGKFTAIIEKIPYLKNLGITAVELMPIYAFNEKEYTLEVDNGISYCNFWGYSSIHFLAPMGRFGTDPLLTLTEFKELIRALHKEKIEVILDVVYNHTAEGNEDGPIYNLKALDKSSYYLLDKEGTFLNYSGCGNTVAANDPLTRELLLESLRYWANECQVDGFRFDLASILTRGPGGAVLQPAPLLEEMIKDPLLMDVKLIAEPWDSAGLYQLGLFPRLGFDAEWNGRYRDNVRKFIKGTDGLSSAFATAFCGSTDLYFDIGRPTCSINFITAHDGFTMRDLVSYNTKHNEDNGEHNKDGSNDNESYNYGEEGETSDPSILELRTRQIKNFFVALFCSQGIPMLVMGDEYGHTKKGNNNTWCMDDERNWFSWEEASQNEILISFVSKLIDFRKKQPLLHANYYYNKKEIFWHGKEPNAPDWSAKNRFVACSLFDIKLGDELYIAFNSSPESLKVRLPVSLEGHRWQKVIDTSAIPPDDFLTSTSPYILYEETLVIPSYTSIVLMASHL